MARVSLNYSKGEVRRAGELLRSMPITVAEDLTDEEIDALIRGVDHAFDVAENWRACHSYALAKATMGLRSRVQTAGATLRVSQRHKRMATIIDKLSREPGMRLDRMHDIAGCRAVVDSVTQVRAVQRRYEKRPPPGGIRRVYDYIAEPKGSGYRGVHVVAEYDERLVEVQLRTVVQHEWAVTVERLGGNIGADLKSGRGPEEVVSFLSAVAEAMDLEDQGKVVDEVLLDEISHRREAAVPHFRRTHERG